MFRVFFILLTIITSLTVKGEVVLSLNPVPFPIHSSSIGMKMGSFLPYIGIDGGYFSIGKERHDVDYDKDGAGNWYKHHESKDKRRNSATLIITRIGLNYIIPMEEVYPYFNFYISKCLPIRVDAYEEYGDWRYDSLGNVTDSSYTKDEMEDEEKFLKSFLGFWNIGFGIGGEYFIKDKISIKGECNFNLFTTTGEGEGVDISDYDKDEWKDKLSTGIGFTSTKFTVNFYFGK